MLAPPAGSLAAIELASQSLGAVRLLAAGQRYWNLSLVRLWETLQRRSATSSSFELLGQTESPGGSFCHRNPPVAPAMIALLPDRLGPTVAIGLRCSSEDVAGVHRSYRRSPKGRRGCWEASWGRNRAHPHSVGAAPKALECFTSALVCSKFPRAKARENDCPHRHPR